MIPNPAEAAVLPSIGYEGDCPPLCLALYKKMLIPDTIWSCTCIYILTFAFRSPKLRFDPVVSWKETLMPYDFTSDLL